MLIVNIEGSEFSNEMKDLLGIVRDEFDLTYSQIKVDCNDIYFKLIRMKVGEFADTELFKLNLRNKQLISIETHAELNPSSEWLVNQLRGKSPEMVEFDSDMLYRLKFLIELALHSCATSDSIEKYRCQMGHPKAKLLRDEMFGGLLIMDMSVEDYLKA